MTSINWKPFLISFIAIFVMVTLSKLGIRTDRLVFPQFFYTILSGETYTKILNPQPHPQDNFENIKPRLEQKENDYKIKKSNSIISSAYASQGDFDQSKGYVVVDFDSGEVLFSQNLSAKLPIASITKVMSAVVALDLAKPEESFSVSKRAASIEPTKIEVVPGQRLTLEELLNASLLTSANDAVEVIKDGINSKYGQDVFIRAMNEKAKFLGLKNTHFTNPQGFDNPEHFSSPEDLAVLSHYALKNYPLISQIVQKDYQLLDKNQDHKRFDLYNWNGLIDIYPGTMGIKIGNTDDAGYTTSVVSQRGSKKLITILLGAPGVLERDLWASQLLDAGFEKSQGLKPVQITKADLREKYSTWKYW